MERFDIEKFCKLVQEERITYSYVVPPVVLLLAKHPCVSTYDLSSLRMMNSGAAPLTGDLTKEVYKRIKIPIKQGYGMSEASPVTHVQSWDDWERKMGSVGKLVSSMFFVPLPTTISKLFQVLITSRYGCKVCFR